MNDTLIKVFDVIDSLLPGLDQAQLNSETNLKDLGIDSLRIVQVLIQIEESYSLTFNESDLNPDTLITLGDLSDLVKKYTE